MKLQTFIFVHNQDIILDYIKYNKFNNINNLKYVFLGYGEISKVINLDNVIIARNLEFNMEEFPKLTSFSGWYALWKNNLIDADYVNLFEYDINIDFNFEEKIFNHIEKNSIDVIGYIPFKINDFAFLGHKPWCENLIVCLREEYGFDVIDFIKKLPIDTKCSMTSNHTFKKNIFEEYMIWMDKMIYNIRKSELSGHQLERSISVFYLSHKKNYLIAKDLLHHFQFDSHKTQGISENKFINNYKNLFLNNL